MFYDFDYFSRLQKVVSIASIFSVSFHLQASIGQHCKKKKWSDLLGELFCHIKRGRVGHD